jgi:5-methylcytosine-specific restriction enzyme A
LEAYENYVYKAEVNWSLLVEGLTLPVDNQVIFARNMGRFLQRGETREINLHLNGKAYKANIRNVNFDAKFNRKKDILQIRYPKIWLMHYRHVLQKATNISKPTGKSVKIMIAE